MSLWSDMQRRAEGAEIRKEDEVYVDTSVITPHDMNEMMGKGIVHFKYLKKNGEEREDWGTKFMELVDSVPNGGECPPKRVGYTTYFDVEKMGWRVFLSTRITGICKHIYNEEQFRKIAGI